MRKKLAEISSFETVLCLFVVMIHVLSDSISRYPVGTVPSWISFLVARILAFSVPFVEVIVMPSYKIVFDVILVTAPLSGGVIPTLLSHSALVKSNTTVVCPIAL